MSMAPAESCSGCPIVCVETDGVTERTKTKANRNPRNCFIAILQKAATRVITRRLHSSFLSRSSLPHEGLMSMFRLNEKAVLFAPPLTIEPEALKQIENTATMPFIFKHVAVMPDCHYGKGATVGTVLATKGAIIPAAVGVDIGCGMIAVKTPLRRADIPKPGAVRAGIERRIPMSAGRNNARLKATAAGRIKTLQRLA